MRVLLLVLVVLASAVGQETTALGDGKFVPATKKYDGDVTGKPETDKPKVSAHLRDSIKGLNDDRLAKRLAAVEAEVAMLKTHHGLAWLNANKEHDDARRALAEIERQAHAICGGSGPFEFIRARGTCEPVKTARSKILGASR